VREYPADPQLLARRGCMNCQTHLETKSTFKLPLNADNSAIDDDSIEVEIQTRDTVLKRPNAAGLLSTGNAATADAPFKLETY